MTGSGTRLKDDTHDVDDHDNVNNDIMTGGQVGQCWMMMTKLMIIVMSWSSLCDQKVLQDRKKIINYHDGDDHVSDGHGGEKCLMRQSCRARGLTENQKKYLENCPHNVRLTEVAIDDHNNKMLNIWNFFVFAHFFKHTFFNLSWSDSRQVFYSKKSRRL